MDRDQQLDSLVNRAIGSRKHELVLVDEVASWGREAFEVLERRISRPDFLDLPEARALLSAYWRVGVHDSARATRFMSAQPDRVRWLALDRHDRKQDALGAFAEARCQSRDAMEAALARQVVEWRAARQRANALGGAHAVVDAVLIGDFFPKDTCMHAYEGANEIADFGAAALDPLEGAIESIAAGRSSEHLGRAVVLAYWLVSIHDPPRALAFLGRQPFFVRSLAHRLGDIAFVSTKSGYFVGMQPHFLEFVASMRVSLRANCPTCGSEVDWGVGQNVHHGELVWWRTLKCPCGAQQEEDGTGLPPEEIRSAIIRAQGVFTVAVKSADRVRAMAKLRQEWRWSIEEAARRLRGERAFWTGTQCECSWIATQLLGAGIAARSEPT